MLDELKEHISNKTMKDLTFDIDRTREGDFLDIWSYENPSKSVTITYNKENEQDMFHIFLSETPNWSEPDTVVESIEEAVTIIEKNFEWLTKGE